MVLCRGPVTLILRKLNAFEKAYTVASNQSHTVVSIQNTRDTQTRTPDKPKGVNTTQE
jgi:hypothetical protein